MPNWEIIWSDNFTGNTNTGQYANWYNSQHGPLNTGWQIYNTNLVANDYYMYPTNVVLYKPSILNLTVNVYKIKTEISGLTSGKIRLEIGYLNSSGNFTSYYNTSWFDCSALYEETIEIIQNDLDDARLRIGVMNGQEPNSGTTIHYVELYKEVSGQAPLADFEADPYSGEAPLNVQFYDYSANNPTSWEWNFGDGNGSFEQNPSHTYVTPGIYSVELRCSNAYGSDNKQRFNFITVTEVIVPPVIDFTAEPLSGDKPLTVHFHENCNIPGPSIGYKWYVDPEGGYLVGSNPSYMYTTAGIYDVTLEVTIGDPSNIQSITKTGYITITNPGTSISANFTADVTNGPIPLTVHFTDLSVGDPDEYHWNFGDGTAGTGPGTSTEQNPTYVYTNPGTYTVTLTITKDGETSTETKTAYIQTTLDQGLYNFDFRSVSATFLNNIFDKGWNVNVQEHVLYVRDKTILQPITLEDDNYIKPQLNADRYKLFVKFVNIVGSNRGRVRFKLFSTSTSFSYISKYYWMNELGTYSDGFDIPINLGTNWNLVIEPDPNNIPWINSEIDFVRLELDGGHIPHADFEADITIAELEEDINFTDLSTAGSSPITGWKWQFGDAAVSTLQNPTHKYYSYGTYDVTLTAVSDAGEDVEIKRNYITVASKKPVANFTATPQNGAPPLTVQFTDTSTNNPTDWNWVFEPNSQPSNEQNPTHTYQNPGTYSVELHCSNAYGVDTIVKTNYITVVAMAPVANFTANPTNGPSPLTVQFTDTSTNNPTSWNWTFEDNGQTSHIQNPTYTYQNPGIYSVELQCTNAYGVDNIVKTNYITVVGLAPVANFTSNVTTGIVPLEVEFTDTSTNNPTSWEWKIGNRTYTVKNPNYVFHNSGIYSIEMRCSNQYGEDNIIKNDYITATNPVVADFTASPKKGSAPLAVQFTDISTGDNIVSWEWNFGDGEIASNQNPKHTFATSGVYTITLRVTDEHGLTYEKIKEEYILVDQNIIADFRSDNPIGAAPLEVHFIDTSTGNPDTWLWEIDSKKYTVQNPTHIFESEGTYDIKLLCSNDYYHDDIWKKNYVQVISTVEANFTATPVSGHVPLVVQFTDTSTGKPNSWKWKIERETYTVKNPIHVFRTTGSYAVELECSNTVSSDNIVKTNYITVEEAIPNITEFKYLIEVDYETNLNNQGIDYGEYRASYFIMRNIIGSAQSKILYIDEISPKRTELKLKIKEGIEDKYKNQWVNFNSIPEEDRIANYYSINLLYGEKIIINNWKFTAEGQIAPDEEVLNNIEGAYLIKLDNKLPEHYSRLDTIWVSRLITLPVSQEVSLYPVIEEPIVTQSLIPNFNLYEDDRNNNASTGYKIWDDLLTTNSSTTQDILNNLVSSSNIDCAEINIDYTDYENYIHFSSAQERLDNFKYKIELIETYNSQSAWLSQNTSSQDLSSHLNSINIKKQKVINGFDGYESYLYENSSSYSVTTFSTQSADTWPKSGAWPNWELYSYTSSEAVGWYASQSVSASDYDSKNPHRLINALPEHITEDDYNSEFVTFVHMVGHYFDNIWIYIKGLKDIYKRENDITKGISKDLLYSAIRNLGFEVSNGQNIEDLWRYTFGYDETGSYMQNGVTKTLSRKDIIYETWNRVLNNLPLLLKSKGTKRSIRALINCYGVPNSILSIREDSGPYITGSNITNESTYYSLNHALQFDGGQYIKSGWDSINATSVELRFMLSESFDHPATTSLFRWDDGSAQLSLVYSASNYGYLKFDDGQSNFITSSTWSLYDGDFWNVAITSGSNFSLHLKKHKYGNIVWSQVTSSMLSHNSWTGSSYIYIGEDLYGDIQEFRNWDKALTSKDTNNHTKFLRSIAIENGNAYDDLITRYSFDYAKDLGTDNDIADIRPNQSSPNHGEAFGFVTASTYPYNFNYYTQEMTVLMPKIGYVENDNKTRIVTNNLISNLSPDERSDSSSLFYTPNDSNVINIHFSPTNILDLDIAAYYADYNFDNFIGDPRDQWKTYYPDMKEANLSYWTQYENANNFWDYLQWIKYFDFSMFDVIRKMIPARSKLNSGVLIRPHLLNRSKASWRKLGFEQLNYEKEIECYNETNFSMENKMYQSSIDTEEDINVLVENNMYATNIDIQAIKNITSIEYGHSTYINLETRDLTATKNNYCTDINLNIYTIESIKNNHSTYINMLNDFYIYSKDICATAICSDIHDNLFANPSSSFIDTIKMYCNLNFSQSLDPIVNTLNEVVGYNMLHYKRFRDMSTGYLNPRYNGCLQTKDTTIDGSDPVQIFVTNPNKLIVKDDGQTRLKVK